uniref:ZT_dimer domain-containing protein n=1 Tax=Parastrongyloides trichosuri TaxID=131310 RepID=A0A0N4ZR94_PARTI
MEICSNNLKRLFDYHYDEKISNNRKIKEYYERELKLLKKFQNDLDCTNQNNNEYNKNEELNRNKSMVMLYKFSLIINIVRLFINLFASYTSGSYSVISTLIDSILDLGTEGIIHYTHFIIENTNTWLYPRGRKSLEIVSCIICSIIIGISNVIMIFNSLKAIINDKITLNINSLTLFIIIFGITCKILLLILYKKTNTPSSRVISFDLKNDILTNIVALVCAYIGKKYWIYIDPIGAIIVCLFVVYSWYGNLKEQIPLIVGGQLKQEEYNRIIHLSITHDRRIISLNHIMVYYIGVKAQVELHIVMDEKLSLKDTHDITEELTHKLTTLEFVERVFIYCICKVDED